MDTQYLSIDDLHPKVTVSSNISEQSTLTYSRKVKMVEHLTASLPYRCIPILGLAFV